MTPQVPQGEQASADAGVAVAIRLLERALVAHGSTTDKGKKLAQALSTLVKGFGQSEDESNEIMPAEIRTALMGPAGDAGGGPQTPDQGGPPMAA
jgi:hypothetical protein